MWKYSQTEQCRLYVVNEYTSVPSGLLSNPAWKVRGGLLPSKCSWGGKKENKANLTSSPTANLLPLKTMPLLPSSWSHWFVLGDSAGCCEITPAPLISRKGGVGEAGDREQHGKILCVPSSTWTSNKKMAQLTIRSGPAVLLQPLYLWSSLRFDLFLETRTRCLICYCCLAMFHIISWTLYCRCFPCQKRGCFYLMQASD